MSNASGVLLLLAGYSACGKTTLGIRLRDEFGFCFVEHQALVHELANRKGCERARHWLAKVGMRKFMDETTREMMRLVSEAVSKGGKRVVIDVVYGDDMVEKFRKKFRALDVCVVSVVASEATRIGRIKKRMGAKSRREAIEELRFRDKFLRDAGVDLAIAKSRVQIKND